MISIGRDVRADEVLPHLVLLRLSGDIGTKAKATHARFVARLLRNVGDALRAEGLRARIAPTRNRILVEADRADALAVLARVQGLQTVSLAVRRPCARIEDVVEAGVALFAERVRGRKFAVRAKPVGDRASIRFGSREVERALGAGLLPFSAGVNLDAPDFTAFVELTRDEAFFFPERVAAPGGLPLGVEGRAVALVSGGFDSAVAAWMMLKRGVALDYVFCNLGGATHQLGVLRVMKVISDRWSYGTRPRLHAVDFQPLAEALQARTHPRYWQVLLKRMMVRAAEAVARAPRGGRTAGAIVTGEALGQVSSQTLTNLAVISQATTLPILRPLVGLNKDEILPIAKRIGTHDLSAVVGEYCALVPMRPATEAHLDAVLDEEARLDAGAIERAVIARRVFDLRSVDPESEAPPGLEVDTIPDGAVVIDLRSRAAFAGWHWPDAVRLDFAQALAAAPKLPADRRYLVCCEFGLKSADLAERMRKAGLDAAHLRGGLKRLVALARERGIDTPEL